MKWEDALRQVMQDYLGKVVVWGEFDCCQFVRSYATMLGNDYGAKFVYSTKAEAMRLIAQSGNLDDFLGSILGAPHEPSAGDVVVFEMPGGLGAGVYNGHYVVGMTDSGLGRYSASGIRAAWAV